MKMIVRADDVGYSLVNNIGAFETMEHGVATAADVMLDTPGTEDALVRLRELPYISVGWHAHFWGSPVADASRIPSLVDPSTGRFLRDVRKRNDIVLEEALFECRAQIERCIRILGKSPDVAEFDDTIMGTAMKTVCDEYGIAYRYATKVHTPAGGETHITYPDQKWDSRRIRILDPKDAYCDLYTDSVTQVEQYDPAKYYTENRFHLEDYDEKDILEQSWHPGYLDYFMYRNGDPGPFARNFTLGRILDVEALCSHRLRAWMQEHRIELVNFRDALYGTREYQNHLKMIGSQLYVPFNSASQR